MSCLSQIQRVNLHTCAVLLSQPGNTYSGNTILILVLFSLVSSFPGQLYMWQEVSSWSQENGERIILHIRQQCQFDDQLPMFE